MYDEKYLEDGNVKEIESAEEAMFIIACSESFCHTCARCPVRMYETNKGGSCSSTCAKAKEFLCNNRPDTTDTAIEIYNEFVSRKVKPEEPVCARGTCATCDLSKMHSSGIRWCTYFRNFVHENGDCYKYKGADNIEGTVH